MDSPWVLALANKNERLVHLEAVCFGGGVVANWSCLCHPNSRDLMYRMFAPADCSFGCNAASLADSSLWVPALKPGEN